MDEELAPDNPQTLEEWLWRLKRFEKGIFVRQKINDRWENVSMDRLPPKEWAKYVARWLEDGSLPVRVREKQELSDCCNETVGGNQRD